MIPATGSMFQFGTPAASAAGGAFGAPAAPPASGGKLAAVRGDGNFWIWFCFSDWGILKTFLEK